MNFSKQLLGTLCILFFLCITFNAEAQFKKIKMGKLTDEHKAYKECDFSPGSGAVILKNVGESYNEINDRGLSTHYRFHKIVKILNKDGLGEGDILFKSSGNIRTLKASTYNEINGEWETTKFEKSNLFKEKEKGNRGLVSYKIPMPNVSVGSIIEIVVEIKHLDSFFAPSWYFQDNIPVLFSSYTFSHINDFIYKTEVKSYYPVEQFPAKDISLYIGSSSFKASEHLFVAKNLPPINKDERFAPDPDENASHIEITMSEVRSTVFQNDEFLPKNYLAYAKRLLKSQYFGGYLEKDNVELLSKLGISINAEDDRITRTKIVYKAIQDKIEWDEYNAMGPDKSPSKTIKDAEGNVADINMLLVATLRGAGIKAFPLLASTRANGAPGEISPKRGDFDYLLATIKVDDKYIILDASKKGLPFGMVSRSVLNKSGYIVDLARYGWVPIQDNAIHEEVYVANLKIEDDMLTGSIMTKLGDYAAYGFYRSIGDEKEIEDSKESFKKTIGTDWEWDEINFNEITPDKPVVVKGKISKEFELEDLIYIEPLIFKIFHENPFKEEERISPIDIRYQIKYRLIFNLEIPEGYAVEEVPTSNQLKLPDDGASFKYVTKEDGNKISIAITFSQKTLNFKTSEYGMVQHFYSLFHEQLENMIVLKKL